MFEVEAGAFLSRLVICTIPALTRTIHRLTTPTGVDGACYIQGARPAVGSVALAAAFVAFGGCSGRGRTDEK